MKILIAGAGAVGFHLAELLSNENQDIIVIDTDEEVLEHAANHLDVMTIRGDVTSIEILEQADIHRVNLFLAVTTSETTNLVAAMLAKKMGARQTIARINNPEYLTPERREDFAQMGVDNLFSPIQLAAQEIERLLKRYAFTDVFEFENGKISLIGFTVLDNARLVNKSLR
ncbi:MAG: Trk system potassium transporter TrkA, partial [Bacteroidetes bacterium]